MIALNILLTVCAALGYGFGIFSFFRGKPPLYVSLIVYGVGCAMVGRLFETLQLFINGEFTGDFQVGMFGVIGSFLFFFSANYGQMDSLVDDGSAKYRKYRIIALLAPLAAVLMYVGFVIVEGFGKAAVIRGLETLLIASAAYFHLKHLIIPDVENGIISCIRSYNLLGLLYAFLCMAENLLQVIPLPNFAMIILYLMLSAVTLLIVPVLWRGVKKWTT